MAGFASPYPPQKMQIHRFVVLEHTWNGVHFDVMLENAGALRTWAVDEEIRPEIALKARALPDHRLVYLDYEGPISGDRGHVRQWDRGTYERILWEADRVVVRLMGERFWGLLSIQLAAQDEAEDRDWVLRLGNLD